MYLLGHNAYLTQIESPAVPADPGKGITGSGPTVRWTGQVQAYIDEDIIQEVRQGQLVMFSKTIIDLPVNLPTWPNVGDIVSFVRGTGIPVPEGASPEAQPQNETAVVRYVDGGLVFLGKLRLQTVRTGP